MSAFQGEGWRELVTRALAEDVGSGDVTAIAHRDPGPGDSLTGIVVVDQADPGWEWLFSQTIRGIVTAQGGANSHLAVRCAELGIPAAIGLGEDGVQALRDFALIRLNCIGKNVEGLR